MTSGARTNFPPAIELPSNPFFEAGLEGAEAGSMPLGLISGGLILDSGEAERTFLFRCQDRYFGANTLHGVRTVLLVANDEHVRHYRTELGRFAAEWERIRARIPVLPDIPEPLFIACDIDRLHLGSCWALLDQLRRGVVERGAQLRLVLNQVSPTVAHLAAELETLLREHNCVGSFRTAGLAALGRLALRFHDKARCVELIGRQDRQLLPRHAPTAIVRSEELLELSRWSEMCALYRARSGDAEPPALFLKSSFDSSGNVAARLTAANFPERMNMMRREIEQHAIARAVDLDALAIELRAEVEAAPTLAPLALADHRLTRYKRWQAELRAGAGVRFLLQREVEPPCDLKGRWASIGLSYLVQDAERVAPLAVAAQLYHDDDRLHYLGSYFSTQLQSEVLDADFAGRMERLCQVFAREGWRGPINFDARLDQDGQYQLIHDCNPRLTAVYPLLAVRAALRRQGLLAEEVTGFGYRGAVVWRDPAARLADLSRRGLLYDPARNKGIVVLPNLSRRSGYDPYFVNQRPEEVMEIVATGALGEPGEPGPAMPRW